MADIMQSCPNLVSLDILQQDIPDFISLQETIWPKVTTLSFLCYGGELFTSDHIIAIHKHFPSLTKLSICPPQNTQMTRSVLEYYPRMKGLELLDGGAGVDIVYTVPEST